jgi:F-type H+-transporting ATPase subunit a
MQRSLLLTILFSLAILMSFGSDKTKLHEEEKAVAEEELNTGAMIIDHIIDHHDWHIMDIGHKAISIPLPVILIDNGNFVVFMSSKFEHGHATYKGYKLEIEGDHKGKIVNTETGEYPLDLSITKNVFALLFSIMLLLWVFISIANRYKRNPNTSPKGLQSLLEPLIIFIRDDIAKDSIGEKYEKYLPYLLTIFFFIFFNNLFGLIPFFPFGANLTGNIAITGVLAVFTFIITTLVGNKNYWVHIVNTPGVPWWLKFPVPLMPIVEIMGLFTKPFVLMVRLFANMTAGHIIVLGFISLIFIFGKMSMGLGYGVSIVSVGFSVFMIILDLLVSFIQAYVFTLLSALYFGMATEEHH